MMVMIVGGGGDDGEGNGENCDDGDAGDDNGENCCDGGCGDYFKSCLNLRIVIDFRKLSYLAPQYFHLIPDHSLAEVQTLFRLNDGDQWKLSC